MPKTTVQSIADELRLSKFAVSRALSGKPGVSDETRKAVIETAARLGYQPRATRRPDSSTLRVVIRNSATANRELWIDVRHGIEMQAMREGYELDVVHSDDPRRIEELGESSLGFIMVGPTSPEIFAAAMATDRPVVACGHIVPPLIEVDQISANDEESGVAVGEYLLGLGHVDIVYVHGQAGYPGRQLRLDGLRTALADRARLNVLTFSEDYAGSELAPALRRLVAEGARPTAFFCGSDGVAVTCQSEILRLGLKVPEDITIIGHADYPLATQVTPNLSTVRVPHREIGLQAVQMLRIRQTPTGLFPHALHMRIQLNSTLVERASSGPRGAPDWERALGTPARSAE